MREGFPPTPGGAEAPTAAMLGAMLDLDRDERGTVTTTTEVGVTAPTSEVVFPPLFEQGEERRHRDAREELGRRNLFGRHPT